MAKLQTTERDRPGPAPSARIDTARQRIARDFACLKAHVKTLADLMKRAERHAWADPCVGRVIDELRGLALRHSAEIFCELSEIDLAVVAVQAGGGRPGPRGTPVPPARVKRIFQYVNSESPAARAEMASKQIAWDCWLLRSNLRTLSGLVKSAERRGSDRYFLAREIDQLWAATVQRSVEIFRAVGDLRRAVAAHLTEGSR